LCKFFGVIIVVYTDASKSQIKNKTNKTNKTEGSGSVLIS